MFFQNIAILAIPLQTLHLVCVCVYILTYLAIQDIKIFFVNIFDALILKFVKKVKYV